MVQKKKILKYLSITINFSYSENNFLVIIQEEGLVTYFEDTWIKERERRHSIEKEIEIKESDMYKRNKPPPLFYGDYHKHCTVLKFFIKKLRSEIVKYVQ